MTLIHRIVAAALALAVNADAQILDSTSGLAHGSIIINQCNVATPVSLGAPIFYDHVIQRPVKAFLLESMLRDFAGRTRTERPVVYVRPGIPSEDPPLIVEIYDPVLGFCYTLEQSRHIAHRVKVIDSNTIETSKQLFGAGRGIPRYLTLDGSTRVARPGPSGPQLSQQDLGTEVINDVQANGQRTTQRFLTGSFLITESWKSTEMNRIILVKRYDGASQESTMQVDLNRHPPDPSLFAVPKDYTIVDEPGPFSIKF